MSNKRLIINLMGQIISFICSLGVSFFLTPYIVDSLGREAYGFVGLANNITSYITLFTVAINGMLSRYVTIEFTKKDYAKASGYFSTAIIAQGMLALALIIPMLFLAGNMDAFFDVSPGIAHDVKVLWILIFVTFLCGLPTGAFGVSTFATNRLEISAIINIVTNVLRAGILSVVFIFFTPHVWYIGLASILSNIVSILMNMYAKMKLTPEIKLTVKAFDFRYIHKLVTVGIWNSLNRLQQILATGLDLAITNMFISATEMGTLSIAKAIPTQITALASTISGTFDPGLTITYAKGDSEEFVCQTKFAMKISGFLCSIPMLGFVAFGRAFYSLWMPSLNGEDIIKINILAALTLLPEMFGIYIYPLYYVNTITAKLKVPVCVSIVIGILNVAIVFVLLKMTNLGIYAVAGVSSVLWVGRILVFVPPYAAWSLSKSWKIFYGPLLRGILNNAVISLGFICIARQLNLSSWSDLVLTCGIVGIFGYGFSFCLMFEKQEKKRLLDIIKRKYLKRKIF